MIVGVNKIVIQVEDQDRALEFWTERVGFEVVKDVTIGDERWIEVRPPGRDTIFVLSPRESAPPRFAKASRTSHTSSKRTT
jgi:hypothetical protein